MDVTPGASFPISGTPVATPPSPVYSGTFIPALWSGKLIEKFYDATVLAAISNTDYEGEIRNQGDKVIIRTKPTISISDYEAYQTLAIQAPSSNVVELDIDKGKYWNTILDDVMEVQADLNMLDMWADDASEQMKIAIDSDVLPNILAGIAATNVGETAGRISINVDLGATGMTTKLYVVNKIIPPDGTTVPNVKDTEVIELITRAGQVLDEQNIPESGRWMIIPAWMAAMIKNSELKDASISGDAEALGKTSIVRNGRLGIIDRFTLYLSNLLPFETVTEVEWTIYAGHSHGLTFASQVSKVETLRAESTFGTLLRGLQVYGYKVVDGTALVGMIVTAGAGART